MAQKLASLEAGEVPETSSSVDAYTKTQGCGPQHAVVLALESGDLCGSQARRLLHDSLGFFYSSDYAADAISVADLVVLKALWRIGELDRTHLIAPEPSTVCQPRGASALPSHGSASSGDE